MSQAQNPFFKEYTTPLGTVPFNEIKTSHYEEAIDRGIKLAKAQIDAIAAQKSEPTFENTIVAMENSGKDLDRVLNVFFNLNEANSNPEMMDIAVRASAKLSDYSTSIIMNQKLWKRVKAVYDKRSTLNLCTEDSMLLDNAYRQFAENGAELKGKDRDKYRKIVAELSELTTRFGQNVLKELNTYKIWLTKDDLAGLPESSVEAAAHAAKEAGREGEYLFTLAQPTYMAFMKFSARRDLREKMYRLYCGRNITGEFSNLQNIRRITELRLELAKLFGYKNFASYSLRHTMAEKPENVYNLLDQLRDAYRPAQQKELSDLTKFASAVEGKDITIMPWDYSYYSNKLKKARFDYDEEELRPYFELSNVIDGVFGLATKLYGLKFTERTDIQVYHPDVKAFEVTGPEGDYVGVIYTDFFPRESKRPGAWMTEFKPQFITASGENSRPHVSIVMNFTKPTADKPSLLTPYEVETFLHEFGHSLHGLLANTRYASMSGTSVYRDFVELPSQFNENYLTEKEFLDGFAKHYITGEPIPQSLVDKIVNSAQYAAGYACLRQLMFGYLDMAFHTITAPIDDPVTFENEAIKQVEIFEPIDDCAVAPQFNHIFSGGYAAGYYSYKWAEVLDADAFSVFKKNGIFDKKSADAFRTNILMRGGTEHPAVLYRRFRGQDPTIDALLVRDGIKK